jgi:hypothetical protein
MPKEPPTIQLVLTEHEAEDLLYMLRIELEIDRRVGADSRRIWSYAAAEMRLVALGVRPTREHR